MKHACRKHIDPTLGCALCDADVAAERIRARNAMTYEEFVTAWVQDLTSGLRYGQQLFNSLQRVRRDLANELRGTDVDPFYDDSRLPAAFSWIKERWS